MDSQQSQTVKRLLLIDTDAGNDDAQAIVMALGCPDVEVLAITTVQGNTDAPQVSRNVRRLLSLTNRSKALPIYQGCELPLVEKHKDPIYFHGEDGFGDLPDCAETVDWPLEEEHAVLAMVRLAKQYSGRLTLVCLGPLTNVAMAIRLCPGFGKLIKDCFCMGGNYHGVGNSSSSAEFNFYNDPESAQIVLSELECSKPLSLVCWETCRDNQLTWEQYEDWLPKSNSISRFFREAEKICLDYFIKIGSGYILCDQIAMAAVLDPSTVSETDLAAASVELIGAKTRGQMVIAWMDEKAPPNVRIIKGCHLQKVMSLFTNAMESLEKK